MEPKVMTAEAVRTSFRDVLDEVMMGETISVARYSPPVAVIVSAREYERLVNDHRLLIEYLKAEDPANDIPWEQIKAEMDAQPEAA
jgi:prevent-host-death family protein